MNRGPWMMLASGQPFYPLDPLPDEIDIADVARALSQICRYGGHVSRFYSVAEHCVLMAEVAPKGFELMALLHDAAEAYLGDIPRPLKYSPAMAAWREAEAKVEAAIGERFGVPFPIMATIKALDDRIILDEWAQLMPASDRDIGVRGEPLGVTIHGWMPNEAQARFLDAYRRYGGGA